MNESLKLGGNDAASTNAVMASSEDSVASVENIAYELHSIKKDSLGHTLLDARMKRGISISDVAQSIKFSTRQIEAIECDDFDKLPGTTFMRGFIRSYAKFLHLDPIPLLDMFDKQVPQVAVSMQTPPFMGAALPKVSERRYPSLYLKFLLILLALSAVTAAYILWPPSTKNTAIERTEVATPPVSVALVASSLPTRVEHEPGNVDLENMKNVPDAQVLQSPAPDLHQLIFIFDGKSWVEVRDSSKTVIFAQNNEPGSRQVINGKPPFALVIGNASQVQLVYEDRQVDLLPFTRVDVARFNLE